MRAPLKLSLDAKSERVVYSGPTILDSKLSCIVRRNQVKRGGYERKKAKGTYT
jgi:hypothetical protein